MKKRVAIVTNIIPAYRKGFYDNVFAEKQNDYDITVFCQKDFPGNTIKSIHSRYAEHVHEIEYTGIFKGKLIWQWLPIIKLFRNYSVFIVDGNPRHLSQALLSTIFRLLGKKVVIWSVAHSWRDHSFSKKIRLLWWKLFDNFLMYTENDVVELNASGFKHKNIISINNGLNQREIVEVCKQWNAQKIEEWKKGNGIAGKKTILSCGRLLEGKYEVMVPALAELVKADSDIVWCVVGNGPAKGKLEKMVKEAGLEQNVKFVGALYEQTELAPWFLSALIFAHPTAIGLSILHAFGYGLPVVTHDNAKRHGSEFSVFENNITGKSYNYESTDDLVKVTLELLTDNKLLQTMKENVASIANEKYNAEIMKDRFFTILKSLA